MTEIMKKVTIVMMNMILIMIIDDSCNDCNYDNDDGYYDWNDDYNDYNYLFYSPYQNTRKRTSACHGWI